MGRDGEGWEKRVSERGRMSFWIVEQWVLAQEKDGE
jgi:hypothetical protein